MGRRLGQALGPLTDNQPAANSLASGQDAPQVEPGRTIALQVIPFRD